MEITKQYRRRRRNPLLHGEQNALSIDRLSDLPDSVLTHILSFLPTKVSVRTSILSRRWRFLWTDVPTLDFFGENENFIKGVMLRHKVQRIDTFFLERCEYQIWDDHNLKTWVTWAIDRSVQNLHLNCFYSEILPSRRLFTCKSLVVLTLVSCDVFPMGGAVCLPRLKKLDLIDVEFEADEALPHLLSGCPVLEEFLIDSFTDLVSCIISSPTIKRLTLSFGESSDRFNTLEINTPALCYLKIDHRLAMHMESGQLTSLIEAYISIYEDEDPEDSSHYSRLLLQFIDRLCNVKCLQLDLSFLPQIVDSVLSPWTTKFHNLTTLELTTADCPFLPKFLENADNLEILIFRKFRDEVAGWTEPPQVPTCLLSHLRIIKLVDIGGENAELEIIRYFLRNAKILERMEIGFHNLSLGSVAKINMLEKISLFQRGSTACQVSFHKYVRRLYLHRS